MTKLTRLLTHALSVVGLLVAVGASVSAQTPPSGALHSPILPLTPAEMLTLLPDAPKGWELKQSRARNTYTDWLHTEATREFSHPAPSSATGSLTPSPGAESPQLAPWITRVKILDSGYNPTATGDFTTFKLGKEEGVESLLINGLQAHLATLGKGAEQLRISVRRRFIVQIETETQPANASAAWAKTVDFTKLAQVLDGGSNKMPRPIPLVTVDELDPKKNRVSNLHWASEAEVDAASKLKPSR